MASAHSHRMIWVCAAVALGDCGGCGRHHTQFTRPHWVGLAYGGRNPGSGPRGPAPAACSRFVDLVVLLPLLGAVGTRCLPRSVPSAGTGPARVLLSPHACRARPRVHVDSSLILGRAIVSPVAPGFQVPCSLLCLTRGKS